jgi:hypothetical protein
MREKERNPQRKGLFPEVGVEEKAVEITKESRVTSRAIIIGLLLIPLNCYWIMQVEGVWHSGHPTCISLYWNVTFNILLLVLINLFFKRFAPSQALTQGELITIYVMLCMASSLAGHDMYQLLVAAIGFPFYYATPDNEWERIMQPYVPKWLTISKLTVIRGFYEGFDTFYRWDRIRAWFGPTMWFSFFTLALIMVMVGINVLVRKQWTEKEKLTYPIITLPLAITERGGTSDFFRNRMLWIGFAIFAAIDLMNGLHGLYPAIPLIKLRHDQRNWGTFFTTPPWNAIGWVPVPLYPFLIAMGFFLPLDLSFSIWFFYVFRKMQQVFTAAIGFQNLPRMPYLSEQSWGAWIFLAIFAIYMTRSHLKEAVKRILGMKTDLDDTYEPMRYRTAAACVVGGLLFISLFSWKAGMVWWSIPIYFGAFYALSIAITRVRAELGPPAHEMAGMMNSPQLLINIFGVQRLGKRTVAVFPYYWFFSGRGYRQHPMPHQLEAMKMAERTGMDPRKLGLVAIIAVFVGSISSFWAACHLSYRLSSGGIQGHTWGQFNLLYSWLNDPGSWKSDPYAVGAMVVGGLFAWFLAFMRTRFLWWPFHPAGYALSMNFGVEYFWFCLVISWAIKWIILRYAGINAYRKAIPFMFGIILGEYSVGAFWSVLSVIMQRPIYDFAPG